MRIRAILLLLCGLGWARADQVVLVNGDTITGSIVKKDGSKLTLKSPFMGEVTIPWSAVKSLKSDGDVVVVLPDDQTVTGRVETSGETIQVGGKSAPLAQVKAVRNPAEQRSWERIQHPGMLQLWTGSLDLGLALVRGDAKAATLTSGFALSRTTRVDKTIAHFDQIYSSARTNGVNAATANAFHGGWTYNRDFTPRLFATADNQYDHDRFQELNLRFVLGGGIGGYAVKSDRTQLSFVGGVDYSRENFFGGVNRDSAEGMFGDDLLFKVSSVTAVTQSFRVFPNISNTGEYRVSFDLSAATAIKKWLAWHLTASDRFLSNPVPGSQRNSLVLSTGFRLLFAR